LDKKRIAVLSEYVERENEAKVQMKILQKKI